MPKFKIKKPKVKKLEGNFFEQGSPSIMADMRDSIAKIIGRDPYMNDSDIMETEVRHWFGSGSTHLDMAMGGGYPAGRLIEIVGEDRRGKTAMTLIAIAKCQKQGGQCFYIDTEGTLDKTFATMLGVDLNHNFMHIVPDHLEQVIACINTIRENLVEKCEDPLALIVFDTVAGIDTLDESEYFFDGKKERNPPAMATCARKLHRAFRSGLVRSLCRKGRIGLIFVNQLHESPTKGLVSYGGRGIKFQASVRIRLDQADYLVDSDNNKVGLIIEADVLKNKVSPPFKKALITFFHDRGVDDMLSTVLFLESKGRLGVGKTGWVVWKDKTYRRSGLSEVFRTEQGEFIDAINIVKEYY
jgi:recombination protein RecA